MKLIVTEKPDVARHFARALGCTEKAEQCHRGNGWIVTWTYGHLAGIAEPEVMDPRWGGPWQPETLPMIPSQWKYGVREDLHGAAKKQVRVLKSLMTSPEVAEIFCATDAGREGELIFRLVHRVVGSPRKPVRRVWNKDLSDRVIRRDVESAKPWSAYDNVAVAAESREIADWLVGLNATRAFTLRNGVMCSVGRVQTPTLALVVARQREIDAFRPTPYHEIEAILEPGFRARYVDGKGEAAIAERPVAEAILGEVRSARTAVVRSVEEKDKTLAPPPLFDLTALQAEADRRFGYGLVETLAIAQRLYESQLLTYPRSASHHLPTGMVETLHDVVRALPAVYGAAKEAALSRLVSGPPLGKAYVDDAKLTDHHALIPTATPAGELAEPEANIYRLVVERFLAIFLPDAVRTDRVVLLEIGRHPFQAHGSSLKTTGWKGLLAGADESNDEESAPDEAGSRQETLPPLKVGEELHVREVLLQAKETRPPRAYSEGALGKAMEKLGLGTVATRPPILKRLFAVGYLMKSKRALKPTPKGVALIDQVPGALKDAALTASFEEDLATLEAGRGSREAFVGRVEDLVRRVVASAAAAAPIQSSSTGSSKAIGRCRKCGQGEIRKVETAGGGFYGCSRYKEGCDFTIPGRLLGKAIGDRQATELVTKGQTGTIKGFKSKKNGKQFDASLKIDEAYRVAFAF